ncbi:MAG: helical backbone metal receptor, partial [Candidatus Omnitrophica bacterium]|nr:helical backbone metal receptor [Candidatus Omnitrophota bacterium]
MSKRKYFLILFLSSQFFLNGLDIYSQEKKIISLGPAFTKAVDELNAQDKLIGYTSFCHLQDESYHKEIVATIIDVNIEKIIELNPDVILASQLTNRRSIELLSKAGFSVVVFQQPKNFNQLCDQFRKIAEITGTEKKAEKIIKLVREEITQIQAETDNLYRPKVFIQIGARPLFTDRKSTR